MTYLGPSRHTFDLGPVSRIYADDPDELTNFVRKAGLPGDIVRDCSVPHLIIADANREWSIKHGAIPHTAWQFFMWVRTMDTHVSHHPVADMDFPPRLTKLDYAEIRILCRSSGHSFGHAPAFQDEETRRSRTRLIPMVEASHYCSVCHGCDGNLPTHCPRRPISSNQAQAIYDGLIDYRDGHWVPVPTVHMAQIHGFIETPTEET